MSIIQSYVTHAKGGYVEMLKKHPGLALSKLFEEFYELMSGSQKIDESADLLLHLLAYLSGIGVELDDINNELNRRHWNPKLLTTSEHKTFTPDVKHKQDKFYIAITGDKYCSMNDEYILDKFGIQIHRGASRDEKITYTIIDQTKYDTFFNGKQVIFVGIKPKDMSSAITNGQVDAVITYNTALYNLPDVFEIVSEDMCPQLKLALIQRNEDVIDISEYNKCKKLRIASEHIMHVSEYLRRMDIDEKCYTIDKILGSGESYLRNETKKRYDLCDAVVDTGKSLVANELKVWKYVLEEGQVSFCFAKRVF